MAIQEPSRFWIASASLHNDDKSAPPRPDCRSVAIQRKNKLPSPHDEPSPLFSLTPQEWTAVHLSLLVAGVGTLASLPIGVLVAYALARWRFPGRTLLNIIVHLPLVLPPVVTGYLLLIWLGRRSFIGGVLEQWFGIVFSFRWTGAAVAAGVMGFPLMVRAIRLSFEAIDRRLEDAAGTLGAAPFFGFLLVSLPLALPGVLAGALLAFAKALGEFGATITFVSNIPGETQTISAAIYGYIQAPDGDLPALRLMIISVIIAVLALVASELLQRLASRSQGAAIR